MKQYISNPKKRYAHNYRRMRLGGGNPFAPKPFADYDEIEKAAILSYDSRKDEFYGWSNSNRMNKFTYKTTNKNELDYGWLSWPHE